MSRKEGAETTSEGPEFFLARPGTLLKVEGMVILISGAALYWLNGGSWWLFVLLLLAPDASMLGYLAGPKVGAAAYNAFHSYPVPAALGILGLVAGSALAVSVALVWFAHIGLDRAIGYGLKYQRGFKSTHMERL